MKYFFIILFFTQSLFAQNLISGKITDRNFESCVSASVLIKDLEDNILAYSISDNKGVFTVKFNSDFKKGFILEVNHMAFQSYQTKYIKIPSEPINIILREREQNLDEHIVKYTPPIKKKRYIRI